MAFGPILGYLCSEEKALRNKSAAVASVVAVVCVYKQSLWKKAVSSFRVQQMPLKKNYFQEYSAFFQI